MAKTVLKVKVYGGTPPFSIKVILFKEDKEVKNINKAGTFDLALENLSGSYSLMVSGPNPLSSERKTIISVDTDEIKLLADSDPNPATRTGRSYMVQYFFIA